MSANHRMEAGGKQILRLLVFNGGLGVIKASARNGRRVECNSRSVHSTETVKKATEFGGEAIVRTIRTREHSVIANGGHFNSVQDGAKAGLSHVRVVRMPGLPKIGWCASFTHDLDHVRVGIQTLDNRVTIDFSEALCQRNLFVRAQFLASEEDHPKEQESSPDFFDNVFTEGHGEVYPRNLGPKRCSYRSRGNVLEHRGIGGQSNANFRYGKINISRKGMSEILSWARAVHLHRRKTALHDPDAPRKELLHVIFREYCSERKHVWNYGKLWSLILCSELDAALMLSNGKTNFSSVFRVIGLLSLK
mmetsp:Transcript_3488/g.6944  ORF Transcript_3488/g.6944 Transcript_3488/m.6944 type:complete len:306 (+) Transcript_3488:584-1501(+)